MQHVDEGRLHAWLDGELPGPGPDGARALERHLGACAACRLRADEERSIREQASAILRGADPGEHAAPRVIPLTPSAAVPHRDDRRRWVAAGWAASVLLALGVGWMARTTPREQVAIDPAPAPAAAPRTPSPAIVTEDAAQPTAAAQPDTAGEPPVGGAPASVSDMAAPAAVEPPGATLRRERAEPPMAMPASPPPPPPPSPTEVQFEMPPMSAPPPLPPPPAVEAPAPVPSETTVRPRTSVAAEAQAGAVQADALAADGKVTVRGQVTDASGRALRGAQVTVPGTRVRTVTGADGSYALSLPAESVAGQDSVLVRAQIIGMQSQTRLLRAGRESEVDFALTPSAIALDAIVVTGTAAGEQTSAGSAPTAASAASARARATRQAAGAAGSVAWRGVDRAEAERRLGQSLVTVPELPVVGIEVAQVEGRAAVRVRQRLEDGGVLSLVQRQATRPRPKRGDALSRAVAELEGSRITLELKGLVVDASAPLPSDSLRQILGPVREMN